MVNNAQKYIGETRTMNCGMKATIIEYRNACDIDVQFENKAIRQHMTKHNFMHGAISPKKDHTKTEYIKETRMMKCGLKATIIEYRNCKDIDVQFENGIIRQHTHMSSFKKGAITDIPLKTKENYIGMVKTMTCGMKAKIIDYRGIRDIDVQFEDNTIVEHTRVNNFKKQQIRHDVFFNTYHVKHIAFTYHDTPYFDVTYTRDNMKCRDIMSIDDMRQQLQNTELAI